MQVFEFLDNISDKVVENMESDILIHRKVIVDLPCGFLTLHKWFSGMMLI